jgi:hypothetical protein
MMASHILASGLRTGSQLRAGGSQVMGSPGFALRSVKQYAATVYAATLPARSQSQATNQPEDRGQRIGLGLLATRYPLLATATP